VEFPNAVNAFINMIVTYVGRSLNPKLIDEIGIKETLAEEIANFPLAQAAFENLTRQL
jgi:uncharacterized protein YdeI (YjbR/CyaY-like superfamily)